MTGKLHPTKNHYQKPLARRAAEGGDTNFPSPHPPPELNNPTPNPPAPSPRRAPRSPPPPNPPPYPSYQLGKGGTPPPPPLSQPPPDLSPLPANILCFTRHRPASPFFASRQAVLANIATGFHESLGLDGVGHMFLFDLEKNPYERTSCPDGGNHAACSNLYHHAAYSDVREELEAIMETVSCGVSGASRATRGVGAVGKVVLPSSSGRPVF